MEGPGGRWQLQEPRGGAAGQGAGRGWGEHGALRPEDSVSALSVTPSQWRVFEQVNGTV